MLVTATFHTYRTFKMTEWIKCSDRLPSNEQEILFYIPNDIFKGVFYNYDNCFESDFITDGGIGYKTDAVSHWMPLPDPPIYINEGIFELDVNNEEELQKIDVTYLYNGCIYFIKNKCAYKLIKNIDKGSIPTNIKNCFWEPMDESIFKDEE